MVAHLQWKFGNFISDSKVGLALRPALFDISALDQHWSNFWRFCECLTCTMEMIQPSDPVVFSGIEASGKYSTIPVRGKSCFDLSGCCAAFWLRMMPNPSYCPSQDIPQTQELWNIFLNEIFCLECEVEVSWWREANLHKLLRRHVDCCPWWSLMPY